MVPIVLVLVLILIHAHPTLYSTEITFHSGGLQNNSNLEELEAKTENEEIPLNVEKVGKSVNSLMSVEMGESVESLLNGHLQSESDNNEVAEICSILELYDAAKIQDTTTVGG